MFFKSKKEKAQKAETAPVIEKKELLYRENIRTGCAPATKRKRSWQQERCLWRQVR